jgi:hypothetical protein
MTGSLARQVRASMVDPNTAPMPPCVDTRRHPRERTTAAMIPEAGRH